ncbi:hypothetical protein MTO96_017598 [Rhipicephalus appendiculatus]
MYVVQENVTDTALSSAEQSGISSENKANGSSARLRLATLVICTSIFLAFLITAMTVAVVTLTDDSDTKDEVADTEEPPAITERDLGEVREVTAIIPEVRTPVAPITTWSRPVPPTTTLPTTETPKKDTWVGLLCTIGTKLTNPQMIPDDDVCDYLIYDSVYKKGPTPFDPNNVDPSLDPYSWTVSHK